MLSISELTSIARSHLKDANVLLSKGRYDGAAYLCGYAVEIALKARIVKTLKWSGFPAESHEFQRFDALKAFKSHKLEMLLYFTAWDSKIKLKLPAEWSEVKQWDPESRYRAPGYVIQAQAASRVQSARKIVEALL